MYLKTNFSIGDNDHAKSGTPNNVTAEFSPKDHPKTLAIAQQNFRC